MIPPTKKILLNLKKLTLVFGKLKSPFSSKSKLLKMLSESLNILEMNSEYYD